MAQRTTHEWFTPTEAAAYLGVSPATVRRLAKAGRLRLRPISGNGRATVCHRTELQRLSKALSANHKRKRKRAETPEEKARRESFERLEAFRKKLEREGKGFDVLALALEEKRERENRGWIE